MKIKAKKTICLILSAFLIAASLTACASKPAEWNGKTIYTHVLLGINETDLFQYVGSVDYVFVGKVLEADHMITEENDKSTYGIRVEKNIKGQLIHDIRCSKHGGLLEDGTLLLYESDRIRDTGLPEVGKTYIFMAYAQSDGSLLLSEFYGNTEYTEESLAQFENYHQNQIVSERERFVSKYDACA